MDLQNQYQYDDLFSDDFGGNFGHATVLGNRILANNIARELMNMLEINN